MDCNKLSGDLPQSLFQLTNLTTLHLQQNDGIKLKLKDRHTLQKMLPKCMIKVDMEPKAVGLAK